MLECLKLHPKLKDKKHNSNKSLKTIKMESWTPRNAQMSYAENNDLMSPNWQANRSILSPL